jgi:hypothetical protein
LRCTALEMWHRCKPIGGSNPSLSAIPHCVQPEEKGNGADRFSELANVVSSFLVIQQTAFGL